jgi:hypothetical protein
LGVSDLLNKCPQDNRLKKSERSKMEKATELCQKVEVQLIPQGALECNVCCRVCSFLSQGSEHTHILPSQSVTVHGVLKPVWWDAT